MTPQELKLYISMYVPYGAEICLAKDHSVRDTFKYEDVESVFRKEWLLVLKPMFTMCVSNIEFDAFYEIKDRLELHRDIFNLIPAGYAITK